jgi:hypothetical protein
MPVEIKKVKRIFERFSTCRQGPGRGGIVSTLPFNQRIIHPGNRGFVLCENNL